MNKIELIVFSVLAVISVITAFDFMTFVLKSPPKQSYLTKRFWTFGAICIMSLVYWYMNGMRFL